MEYHVIYLFNHIGKQHKTQEYVAQVMNSLYRNTPDGLCGNEDCGQMSAWYVMSAMGFYPVNPVSGEYELGVPLFPQIRLNLENGKTFRIKAPEVGKERIHVTRRILNGTEHNGTTITHNDIMSGATLEIELSGKSE